MPGRSVSARTEPVVVTARTGLVLLANQAKSLYRPHMCTRLSGSVRHCRQPHYLVNADTEVSHLFAATKRTAGLLSVVTGGLLLKAAANRPAI